MATATKAKSRADGLTPGVTVESEISKRRGTVVSSSTRKVEIEWDGAEGAITYTNSDLQTLMICSLFCWHSPKWDSCKIFWSEKHSLWVEYCPRNDGTSAFYFYQKKEDAGKFSKLLHSELLNAEDAAAWHSPEVAVGYFDFDSVATRGEPATESNEGDDSVATPGEPATESSTDVLLRRIAELEAENERLRLRNAELEERFKALSFGDSVADSPGTATESLPEAYDPTAIGWLTSYRATGTARGGAEYFRFNWRHGSRIMGLHIPGGNVNSELAQTRAAEIEKMLGDRTPRERILEAIASWRRGSGN